MKIRYITILILIAIAAFAIGCSGGAQSPLVTPTESSQRDVSAASSHSTWGLWQFKADPENGTLDIAQLRTGNLHLNALPFLEPPLLVNLTLESLAFNGNIIDADIGLRHPFIGLTEFTGFDVCGLVITNGSVTGFSDNGIRMAGAGDTRLLNPDGYSRWWNPVEFPADGTMFGYKDGLLGTPDSAANFNSTLNGYKYFCDDLGSPDAPLTDVTLQNRGLFTAGNKNVRHYKIELGTPGLVFNYAVDASWQFPQGSPPWTAPDDFSPQANRPEAWRVDVSETNNTLWNDDAGGSGGDLSLSINVYDWFNAGLNTVKVESPGQFVLVEAAVPTGGGLGYSTYEIDISDATPDIGSIDLLLSVASEVVGFQGFISGVNTTSYFIYTASVATTSPSTPIYVDGDNQSGIEDGSQANPYNTIQEAIDAASVDYIVRVDAVSGGAGYYDEPVTLKTGVSLTGDNWNGGTGKPKIHINSAGGYAVEVPHMIGDSVSDIVIDNLELTSNAFFIEWWGGPGNGYFRLLYLNNCTNVTVSNCKFDTTVDVYFLVGVVVNGGSNISLEHNEFVNLFNTRTFNWGAGVFALIVSNTTDCHIKHNEIHHLNWQNYHNWGDAIETWTYGIAVSAAPSGLEITNNLIYDIHDLSEASGALGAVQNGSYYYYYNGISGITVTDSPGAIIANNTIDDLNPVAAAGGQAGVSFGIDCGQATQPSESFILKNNIVSNLVGTEITSQGWYHASGFESAFTLTATYSEAYNIDVTNGGGGYQNSAIEGTGCFDNGDYENPTYGVAGPDFYHVGNPVLVSDDGTEMGAFGGPGGSWLPPSQGG